MMCLIDLWFNPSANYLAIEFALHVHYASNEKKMICAPLSQFEMFTFPDINQLISKNINHLISKFKSTKKNTHMQKSYSNVWLVKITKNCTWAIESPWIIDYNCDLNTIIYYFDCIKKSHLNKLQHLCSDNGFSNGYKLFKINL